MKEEIIKAIEENRLADYIIDNYGDMSTRTVKSLLILLAEYIKAEDKENLIEDIKILYKEEKK